MDMDAYLSQVGKSEEEVREEVREEARKDLDRSLVMTQLAEDKDIKVSPEEVDQEIDAMASRSGGEADSMRNVFSSPDGRRTLEDMIRSRKVMEWLREIATGSLAEVVMEGAPEPEESDKEKEPEVEGGKPDGDEA